MTTDTKKHTAMKDGPAWPKGKRVRYVRQMALAEDGNHYSANNATLTGPVVVVWQGILGDVVGQIGTDILVHFPESPTFHSGVAFDQVHALYCLEPVEDK